MADETNHSLLLRTVGMPSATYAETEEQEREGGGFKRLARAGRPARQSRSAGSGWS
jgi:hypothetical protein